MFTLLRESGFGTALIGEASGEVLAAAVEVTDRFGRRMPDQRPRQLGDLFFRSFVEIFGRPRDRIHVPGRDGTGGQGVVEAGDLVTGARPFLCGDGFGPGAAAVVVQHIGRRGRGR
jgi:hypothetical protein